MLLKLFKNVKSDLITVSVLIIVLTSGVVSAESIFLKDVNIVNGGVIVDASVLEVYIDDKDELSNIYHADLYSLSETKKSKNKNDSISKSNTKEKKESNDRGKKYFKVPME